LYNIVWIFTVHRCMIYDTLCNQHTYLHCSNDYINLWYAWCHSCNNMMYEMLLYHIITHSIFCRARARHVMGGSRAPKTGLNVRGVHLWFPQLVIRWETSGISGMRDRTRWACPTKCPCLSLKCWDIGRELWKLAWQQVMIRTKNYLQRKYNNNNNNNVSKLYIIK